MGFELSGPLRDSARKRNAGAKWELELTVGRLQLRLVEEWCIQSSQENESRREKAILRFRHWGNEAYWSRVRGSYPGS